ncbi:MAG: flagellin, partial [Bacillota bacterium]
TGGALHLYSSDYGSEQFVSVTSASGAFSAAGTTKDNGADAVVTVNGATAQADGLAVSYRSGDLDVEVNLATAANVAGSYRFDVTGGGATFALGAKVTETDKAAIGIASVSTASLGDKSTGLLLTLGSGGTNSLNSGNLVTAQKIVDKAIKQVSQLRGRLGAFQKFTIGSTVNNLGVAFENASAAESAIRDTDFAEETAAMTRNQILSQAATTVLTTANASPQNALSLLRG